MACGNCSNGCSDCGGLECGEGAAGLDGLNAFTLTAAAFDQPDFQDSAITINVSALGQATGIWAKVGQYIFIEGAGYFQVTAQTATTISVIVPSATIETFNHAIAASGATVAFPKEVSPGGIQGATGLTGSSGGAGTNGTTIIAYDQRDGGHFTNLNYTEIRGPYAIPANSWAVAGDTVRVKLLFRGTNDGTPDATNHIRYNFKMQVGTTDVIALPGGSAEYAIQSNYALNGILVELDLVAQSFGPFILEAVPTGNYWGVYSVGVSIHTPGTSGMFLASTGSIGATQGLQYQPSVFVTSGIDPTISNNFSIEAKHTVVGAGGGTTAEFSSPFTLIELLKK